MRVKLLLFSLLLCVRTFYAQEESSSKSIEYGKVYEAPYSDTKMYLTLNESILSISRYRKKITLQTYNSLDLTLKKSNEFDGFLKQIAIENIIKIKNHIYLFYSNFNKDDEKESLYVREIDVEKSEFKGDAKLLFSVEEDVTTALIKDGYNFNISKSFNENKLLIQYKYKTKKKMNSKIGYKLFDQDLNTIWEKDIVMPYTSLKMGNIDGTIDSEDNIYMVSYVYRNKKPTLKNERGQINYDVELFKIKTKTGELINTKININLTQHINNIKLFRPNDTNIIGAGYASIIGMNDKYNEPSAVFKFDLHADTIDVDCHDLPLGIVNQNIKKTQITLNSALQRRYGKKYWKPSIKGLIPEMIHLTSDGGLLLVGEQQNLVVRNRGAGLVLGGVIGSGGGGYISPNLSSLYIQYGSILFTKFNNDGSLAWIKKLAKEQEGKYKRNFQGLDKSSCSFNFIEREKDLYFLYLDDKKNLSIDKVEVPKKYSSGSNKGLLMTYKLNPLSGETNKMSIQDIKSINGMNPLNLNLSRVITLNKNEFFFEVYGAFKNGAPVGIVKQKEFLIKIKLE